MRYLEIPGVWMMTAAYLIANGDPSRSPCLSVKAIQLPNLALLSDLKTTNSFILDKAS